MTDDGWPHDYGQPCDCPECGGIDRPDPTQWLADLFEFEYCAECGSDADGHDAVPFMGNWFARCKVVPLA